MTRHEMREWRKRLGLTQDQVGQILGVTSRAVAKWEAGQAPIDHRTELATQRYEQKHITMHGIKGLPLLYAVNVQNSSENEQVGETYLVVAPRDYEASNLVYDELGKPSKATFTATWIGKAAAGSTLTILCTMSELQNCRRTRTT